VLEGIVSFLLKRRQWRQRRRLLVSKKGKMKLEERQRRGLEKSKKNRV
jgi:hypothetical protein